MKPREFAFKFCCCLMSLSPAERSCHPGSVHFCCSILYADIVGFTRLASDCSPGELVHMLNELFGKFDQIAKVSCCDLLLLVWIRKSPLNFIFFSSWGLCAAFLRFWQEDWIWNVWRKRSGSGLSATVHFCQSDSLWNPRQLSNRTNRDSSWSPVKLNGSWTVL